MFYQTQVARRPQRPRCLCTPITPWPAATGRPRPTLFAATALQCIFNGEEICPGDLDLPDL